MASDLRDKLSVDFLKRAPRRTKGVSVEQMAPVSDALMLYGIKILSALAAEPAAPRRVLDLAKQVEVPLQDMFPVVDHLVSRGYVRITGEDKLGDHEIELTEAGRRLT